MQYNLEKKIKKIIAVANDNIKKYPWLFNEATVEREIIDPLLDTLGWKFPNIRREVPLDGLDCHKSKADYVLYKGNIPLLIIEVKDIDINLKNVVDDDNNPNKKEIRNRQLQNYFNGKRYPNQNKLPLALTNGRTWYIIKWGDGQSEIVASVDWEYSEKEFYKLMQCLQYDDFDIDSFVFRIENEYPENVPFEIVQNGVRKSLDDFILDNWDDIMKLQDMGWFDGKVISRGSGMQKKLTDPKKLKQDRYKRNFYYTYCEKLFVEQVYFGLKLTGGMSDIEIV